MPSLLRMPEIATDTPEATLVSWSVAENVPYAAHDAIVTVETAKAVVEVEAESDGVILTTLVAQGADVRVGEPIAVIGDPGERLVDLDATLVELGVGPSGAEDGLDEPPGADAVEVEVEVDMTVTDGVIPQGSGGGVADGNVPAADNRIFISPLARRLAREAGVDVQSITGSGPSHRIVRRDVETAISQQRDGTSGRSQRVATVQAPEPLPGAQDRGALGSSAFRDVPHSRMRRAIAARLSESIASAPQFYLSGEPRVDRLLRLRRELNESAEVRISLNDLVIKAVARAHELVPEMNVIWTPDAVRSYAYVDVGVAIATDSGLVTPVLRDVGGQRVTAVATATRDFAERGRSGRLQLHELAGGSITVTNLGRYGTREFAAIINPPQAAILAVGVAVEQPLAHNGKLAVGTVMRVTLSVDHRPIDGATAARWMQEFVGLIETPVRILA